MERAERDMRAALRALNDQEFEDLYARLVGLATRLLRRRFGRPVMGVEARELVDRAYIDFLEGRRNQGALTDLYEILARTISSQLYADTHRADARLDSLDRLPQTMANAIPDELAPTAEQRSIAAELFRKIFAVFGRDPRVRRYLWLKVFRAGATAAEYAEMHGNATVTDIRNWDRRLTRGRAKLHWEDSKT